MMPAPGKRPPADPDYYEQASDDLIDWRRLGQYLSYALGSVGRRPLLFAGVLAGIIGLTVLALRLLPPTYEVEARLLAQKNAALAVRGDQNAYDSPTRAATEIIVRRDNLLELMRQTDLVREWRAHRAPAGQLKDALLRFVGREMTASDLEIGLLGLLQKQLLVWTTPEGMVVIQVRWPDGNVAYRLVDAAQRNFLETRHVLEVSTIAEQIAILESHAAELNAAVEAGVAKLERMREEHSAAPRRRSLPRRAVSLANPTPELTRLQVMHQAKQRAINDLEEFRARGLFEAQTRLAELKAIYSENHPTLLDQQEKIRALSSESPQLAHLRQEEEQLRKQLGTQQAEGPRLPAISQDVIELPADATEDPATEYSRAQLRFVLAQYASLRERIAAARIDLDTARAAFKYRYTVVVPPQKPRQPIKPSKPLVFATAFMVGIIAALLSTTLTDLRRGRVVAAWQLERLVGHKVIEVRRS